ncbi:LysR family transcriptional regulator [Ideonella azotifigens]|uniref:LysR family transcriptional regulator n=1 Tax=Ideonella azotifigens TaxID=513160 RepID=A0ABP3UZS8_9BURK|nr:LysR family transcriptional regulator [Ideonella azotifigens]MCD2340217.1 LysR family transcriptional regulator [Ideonella azotifigens]
MRPDLRQLQALVAVATHGTLARAADTLACSPTAVSMQLAGLQQRLGLTLLRRTGRGLALTAEGEQLLPAARDAVEAVRRFTRLAEGGHGEGDKAAATPANVPITLGTILDPAAIRLGEFLRAVRQRGPQLHPELRHGISGSVMAEVLAGRLDLAFCLGEPDGRRLQVLPLAPVRYVVIAPRGWQARLQGRSWEALAELPWILTPRDSVHHRLLQPLFKRLQQRPRSVARVDQEASMVDLVKAGFGLSLAREAVALREADQAGLAVSRAHALDTSLTLIARPLAANPELPAERAAAIALLFEVAARIWQPGAAASEAVQD